MSKHLHDLECVFQMLYEFTIRAYRDKSLFGVYQMIYLGHHIKKLGIKTDRGKIAANREMPPPRNYQLLQKR